MDIKAEIEKIVAQLTKDGDLKDKFMKDPAATVRGLVGDQADDDTIKKIIDMVKDAITKNGGLGGLGSIGEKISDVLGSILGKKDDDAKEEKKDE
ncbi:MAG: hypothetical protein IKH27_10540 [Oscillospiraceae bacterium]|nr:hypothetical protein [Oscillospiraceae bacterium]